MRVLIVDDSRAMRMIVRRALRQAGVDVSDVREAENGRQALDMLATRAADLVLSDWNMPEMNGLELLAAVRETGSTVRFGFVTSEGTAAMYARALHAGAHFLVAKPFTPEALRDAIEGVGAGAVT